MKAWLLFFLGTAVYFLIRWNNRTDKVKDFNLKFWIKDNWVQLTASLILDVIAMIILMDENTDITGWLATFLPNGLVVATKLAAGALCGLGLGAGAYELFKKKISKSETPADPPA